MTAQTDSVRASRAPVAVTSRQTLALRVRQITAQAQGIHSYELVHPDGVALPAFTAGAHIDVYLENGLVRQYSLANDPAERHRYLIGVLREANGRGGSRAMHDEVHVSRILNVGRPRNNFHLVQGAPHYLLIAGGIGITPLKAMAHQLARTAASFALYYCAKGPEYSAFTDELAPLVAAGRARMHFDGGLPERSLDFARVLQQQQPGTHLYYCGPGGFMRACEDAVRAGGWAPDRIHCEHFKPLVATGAADLARGEPESTACFEVKIASSGLTVQVATGQSIVNALAEHGIFIETSCEAGLCGTCKVRYLSGSVDHRDLVLGPDERAQYLTACVSRAIGGQLELDL